jgi:thioesterase domain-containing protein
MIPVGATNEATLEAYLHEHIPISSAMGITVAAAGPSGVRLWVPLGPNINHRSTVFGGSAAAAAILAGWALLHTLLQREGHGSRIVIQNSSIDYRLPIEGDFEAIAPAPSEEDWSRFERTLRRRGRARIELTVTLDYAGGIVGTVRGAYVVLPLDAERP